MLTLNPDDRITAKQALEHPYFSQEPLPCELSEMPKIEKDCHAYVLNAERKNINLNAMNNANNPNNPNNPNANASNMKKPVQNQYQNKNFNPNNKNFNNPNQTQAHHHNRPHTTNVNPNRHNNTKNPSHPRHDNGATHGSTNTSSDKIQKPNIYSIIPNGVNKESVLSTNLTALFKDNNTSKLKNETVSSLFISNASQAQNLPKETTEAEIARPREQTKHHTQSSQSGNEKTKRPEHTHQDLFPKSHEGLNHKRKTSHDISDFEQITKNRKITDPIEQNS
jgi:hypothetical protein